MVVVLYSWVFIASVSCIFVKANEGVLLKKSARCRIYYVIIITVAVIPQPHRSQAIFSLCFMK